MSTFQGLEMSKRALFAQQGAIYTTGHNISNVNTDGYSRQRVNFETTPAFPLPSRTMSNSAGQRGTGVEIGVIDRIRNKFLDMQYRAENSSLGHWETRTEALSRMEALLNEPSDNGLQKTMDRFWQSLQDLADNPDNDGARSVVAQRGLAVAETFNHFSTSLNEIKNDLKTEINQSADNINGLLNDINEINKQVKKIEPHGQLANDLYDERDRLLDELSGYVNIKVEYEKTATSSLDIADGIATIELVNGSGQAISGGTKLLEAKDTDKESLGERVKIAPEDKGDISTITFSGEDVGFDKIKKTGSLAALIEAHGYDDGKGDYPKVLKQLDDMAAAFAGKFNDVHQAGENTNDSSDKGKNFFVNSVPNEDGNITPSNITAGNITVNANILEDGSLIRAAAKEDAEGNPIGGQNGDNALNLSDVFDNEELVIGDKTTSVRKFYSAVIGEIGVNGQEAARNVANTEILQNQVQNSRMATSAVSLDEEISNLVKFQHAYNAAARNMTTVDEMIDRIINQMGLVGR